MKLSYKKKILLILGFFLLFLIHSQSTVAGDHCLWKVESDDNTVYLLGSIHLLDKASYPLDSEITNAYEASDILVFETNLDSLFASDGQFFNVMKALDPQKGLKDKLDASTYTQVKNEFESMGLQITPFENYEPWFIALTLTSMKLSQMGFLPQYGVDHHFHTKAKEDSKPTTGLETVTYQINIFDNLSEKLQVKLLQQTLEDIDVIQEEITAIKTAWKNGNIDELETILSESLSEYPDLYDIIFEQRNSNWLPQIETFINSSDNYLVIVGALHLVGENGIIERLRTKGYTVKQL